MIDKFILLNHTQYVHYLANLPLRLVFLLFKLIIRLPWTWLMAIGRILGRIALILTPRRAHITGINLKLCFPELDAVARRHLLKKHFASLGMGFMDMGLAWWASEKRLQPWLRIHGSEHAKAAFNQGKGVIFVTAHFSSIEMGGRALRSLGPLHPIYRPHRNPNLEYFIMEQRKQHTDWAIPRHDMRLLLRTLQEGKGVWLAPDQNFGHKGFVFSLFFGIPAATTSATSRLARISGAPVLPFVVLRCNDGPGYDIVIEPALADFPSADPQSDTDRVNAILEGWIRQAPEQYLWSHRRFKDRPPGEERFY